MKTRAIHGIIFLILATHSLALTAAESAIYVDRPAPPPVDHGPREPGNNECTGAIPMPPLTHRKFEGTFDDRLGNTADHDWASIVRLGTETFAARAEGVGVVTYREPGCRDETPPTMLMGSSRYPVDVSSGTGDYFLGWDIISNDNYVSGYDVPDTFGAAHPYSALPSTAAEIEVFGSLSGRVDRIGGPDRDWFRLNTPLAGVPAQATQTGEVHVALGLLTARLNGDCFDGGVSLQLFQEGLTPIGALQEGCSLSSSCISAGTSAVHARAGLVENGLKTGSAYAFSASVSPLYLVNLDTDRGEVGLGYIDPANPWCDPILPRLISFLPEGNAIVDPEGKILAFVPKVKVIS